MMAFTRTYAEQPHFGTNPRSLASRRKDAFSCWGAQSFLPGN